MSLPFENDSTGLAATGCRVVAVIVTYNPEPDVLKGLVMSITQQVFRIIIVDNGSLNQSVITETGLKTSNCQYMCLGVNTGIANAINEGITEARKSYASHFVLFDQDSIPEPGMIKKLCTAFTDLGKQGVKVAGVGARFLDDRAMNPPPFIQIKNLSLKRHTCEHDRIVPVDYLISSGCLISEEALAAVGMMNADLFIDYVDIEWGLRAKKRGYQSFGICDAHMKHALGDDPLEMFGRKYPVRNPLRHYYMFRNAVWLYRQSWVPFSWKVVDGVRLLAKYVFYSVCTNQRMQHLRMMTTGLWHGLSEKMGKYQ